MLNFYIEIKLKYTCGEEYELMCELSHLIHRGLIEIVNTRSNNPIGVAYPDLTPNGFGERVRLFAPKSTDLQMVRLDKHLARIKDHVEVSHIRRVPKNSGHAYYRRFYYLDEQPDDLPFLKAKLSGKKEWIRIYVNKLKAREPSGGIFSSYGLSKVATMPDFA